MPPQLKGDRRMAGLRVKTHGLEAADWTEGAEVKGAPALYEFTQGGALTFSY